MRDRRGTRAKEHLAPESAAVCRRVTDRGLILAALVETWHDGTASPLFIRARLLEVVAAYAYRAEFDVAVAGACRSRWSGATRAFSHDFDDMLESPSMSFVPRKVAGRGRIRVSRAIHSPAAGGLSPCDKGHSEVITAAGSYRKWAIQGVVRVQG